MSVTQDYKTVTLSRSELVAISFALDAKIIRYEARKSDGTFTEATQKLLDTAKSALDKIEAAL